MSSVYFPKNFPSNITPQILIFFLKPRSIIDSEGLCQNSCMLYFTLYTLLENKANHKINLLLNWDLEVEETKTLKDSLQAERQI